MKKNQKKEFVINIGVIIMMASLSLMGMQLVSALHYREYFYILVALINIISWFIAVLISE